MSENFENVTPAEEVVEETLLEAEDIANEETEAVGEKQHGKFRTMFATPLWSSIIKWVCMLLGIGGGVLWLIANTSKSTGESLAKTFTPVSSAIASFFSMIPVPVYEILICATALGILAYLAFIIVKTVKTKGAAKITGLWIQFVYSLLAIAGVFAIMCSLCYGVFTYRQDLSKLTEYPNAKSTCKDLSETMLYLIDNINNTLYNGSDDILFRATGESRYAPKGDSTKEIAKIISEAFDYAAEDIPTLKGKALKTKKPLFTSLYSKYQIASVYSPYTGEVSINNDYPEVAIPMQIAKAMAMQRGYTNDADAEFIAFLVCTQYADDYFVQYSGYFNAYVSLSSKLYNANGKNLHLYLANALSSDAKKDFVSYVKKLDSLYGLSSELEYTPSNKTMSAADYCKVAKLLMMDLRNGIADGTISVDDIEEYNFGKYCNYLVSFYKLDQLYQDEVYAVYSEYHPGDAE